MIEKERGITKRQLQSQKTRNIIFETALNLFAKYSYENVTIDDIAKQSGVAKGSIYTHFSSKDDIMLEQFKNIDACYQTWYQSFSTSQSASVQLLSFVRYATQFVANELHLDVLKVVYTSHISLTSPTYKFLGDNSRPYFDIIANIVRLGQEQGEFRRDLSDLELTLLITRFMRGLYYDWCLADGSFDLEEDGQRYFKLILDILQKNSS